MTRKRNKSVFVCVLGTGNDDFRFVCNCDMFVAMMKRERRRELVGRKKKVK
jgi:hypothetical protein